MIETVVCIFPPGWDGVYYGQSFAVFDALRPQLSLCSDFRSDQDYLKPLDALRRGFCTLNTGHPTFAFQECISLSIQSFCSNFIHNHAAFRMTFYS